MRIAPQSRLLLLTGLVAVPLTAVAGSRSSASAAAALLLAGFAAIVLMDAVRSRGVLRGVRGELPALVRLSKDHEGQIEVRVGRTAGSPLRLRAALPWPAAIQSSQPEQLIDLPAEAGLYRFAWPCRPAARGLFPIEAIHVEASSPFGLWAVREALPAAAQIRVYPNLWKEKRTVGALFLNRGIAGIHVRRQAGRGREFEKLREYVPGDDYDEIHWKATAKRGRPVTKVFQIERSQEIYVVIDSSRLSARSAEGASGEPTLERYLTSTLVLAIAAEQQHDLFGLVTFSDHVHGFVRARGGKAHFQACREAIGGLQPRLVTPDFAELASFLRTRLRRRALLLFLTALDDPLLAESFLQHVPLISRQHLVLVGMLRPAGAHPVFSEPAAASLDGIYRSLGGHYRWQKLRELERTLRRRGVSLLLLDSEQLSAQLLAEYADIKRRQIL